MCKEEIKCLLSIPSILNRMSEEQLKEIFLKKLSTDIKNINNNTFIIEKDKDNDEIQKIKYVNLKSEIMLANIPSEEELTKILNETETPIANEIRDYMYKKICETMGWNDDCNS